MSYSWYKLISNEWKLIQIMSNLDLLKICQIILIVELEIEEIITVKLVVGESTPHMFFFLRDDQ